MGRDAQIRGRHDGVERVQVLHGAEGAGLHHDPARPLHRRGHLLRGRGVQLRPRALRRRRQHPPRARRPAPLPLPGNYWLELLRGGGGGGWVSKTVKTISWLGRISQVDERLSVFGAMLGYRSKILLSVLVVFFWGTWLEWLYAGWILIWIN